MIGTLASADFGSILATSSQFVLETYQFVYEKPSVMKLLNKVGLGLVVAATGAQARFEYPDCNAEPLASNPICDKSLSRAERAAGLVEAMNVQEKLGNIIRYAQLVIPTALHDTLLTRAIDRLKEPLDLVCPITITGTKLFTA